MAQFVEINPLTLMVPGVLSASLAFMMPIATPPNLIVFATKKITMRDITTVGLVMDLMSIVVTLLVTFTLVPAVFGVGASSFPEWAAP